MDPILCFGEILWDVFGDEKVAGGAPMNVARHLAQQRMPVAFASRIGGDEAGKGLAEFLKASGLYSSLIQQDDELPSCEVSVKLDDSGQATYTIPEPVSWDNMQSEQSLAVAARHASAIIYGSLACRKATTRDTLAKLLEQTTALKVFDVNLRPPHYRLEVIETLIRSADVLKMNDQEAALLIGGTKKNLLAAVEKFQKEYQIQTICVTRGQDGAIVCHQGELYEQAGFAVDVVDTVGAGDAFLATFVARLLNNIPMQQILEKACRVGAFVAGKRGANPVYDQSLTEELL